MEKSMGIEISNSNDSKRVILNSTISENNDNNLKETEILGRKLEAILFSSPLIKDALEKAKLTGIEKYYIGAGCITQTVWNYLFRKPLDYGIKDIDFIYYDDKYLDFESENQVVIKIKELYKDFPVDIDVKNQARVHLWYKERFGYEIEPYDSLESAINTWLTTATAIGVKLNYNNLIIYALFGLSDLFGKIIRPNKVQIIEEIYHKKVSA